MRISAAGQITVPEELRRATGLEPGAEVVMRLRPEGGVIVEPEARATQPPRTIEELRRVVEDLHRRGICPDLSGDDVMKLTRGDD